MLDTLKILDTDTGAALPTSIGGIGIIESLRLADGLEAEIQHIQLAQERFTRIEGENLLKFQVRLSGRSELVFQDRHTIVLDGAATAVLMHDAGVSKTERILADRDECTVTTMVARERLFEYLDEEQESMPSSLHSLMVRKRSQPRLAIAAPTRQELDIASAIINCRRAGPLRRLFVEAKTAELFCSILDRLQGESSPAQRQRVTERDRRQLAQVRELLSVSFTQPPTIHQLARRFGLNRNKLCRGFLLLNGATIHEFCDALRMDQARRMLQTSQLSISEIALSAGYGSSSSFSAAFHRRFGHAPSQGRHWSAMRRIGGRADPR